MDDDLGAVTRERLAEEAKRLRAGDRARRDATGHDLCWRRPRPWAPLPERIEPEIAAPPWSRFLRGCVRHSESLDAQRPGAPARDAEYGEWAPPRSRP